MEFKPSSILNNDSEAYHSCIYKNGDIKNPHDWHMNNMTDTVDTIKEYIVKHNLSHIVITDYGTGTGGSIIEVINLLKKMNITYFIYLVDILESWFYKAFELLKDDPNIKFILNSKTDENKKFQIVPINEIINDKSDVVMCGNMIHLIPLKKLDTTVHNLSLLLKPKGLFVLNSGNISTPDRKNYLFDEPFKQIANSPSVTKIFPSELPLNVITGICEKYFKNVIHKSKNIEMLNEEFFNFCCIPRLKNNMVTNENPEEYLKKEISKLPDILTFTWTTIHSI